MLNRFDDRTAAGRALATLLAGYGGRNDVVVLGLPRGGMLPAFEVAGALNGPLDVLVTRKLGAPGAPEFALGAIASGEVTVINESAMHLFLNSQELNSVIAQAQAELLLRETFYRGDRRAIPVAGKTVILVDDGAVTGATMRAAIRAARGLRPARIVAALPVASLAACALLHAEADELVCEIKPAFLRSVGECYRHFPEITDGEVRALLARAAAAVESHAATDPSALTAHR
ncbi:MAG TPA: phosphoribosyltransferase family protein [Steroidobacteraceae bacterium]|jgi:putative phosphoribosyl transferase|nr:phosphoribosyltransferase family protein [Steroidobacteraceae bacterium]